MSDKPEQFSLEGLAERADKNVLAAAKAELERRAKIAQRAHEKLIKAFAPMDTTQNRGSK